ncbi:helix-turn-helix domain-containing protein [Dactylosporangium sp. CA-092794]|uniref:helix-turn-helix domain-containing protein n=1 Tax=Dactylosporangium sp. CA-092794 TaxID=3239929 RepID=UPI003D8AF21E
MSGIPELDDQIDSCGRPPEYAAGTELGARVHTREARLRDAILTDFRTAVRVRSDVPPHTPDELRLYVVHRGSWILRHSGDPVALPGGRFMVRRTAGLTSFEASPQTAGATIALPAGAVGGHAGDRPISGSAVTPEVRLLLAHASLLHDTIDELTGYGAEAARNALIELTRGVVHHYVDAGEPALAPALATAARELADQRLTRPELTPSLLARELHVSVRTLHRAFADTGEPVAAYIRRRRLEEARRALTAGHTVSEVAARWQFADSSHFIRSFRQRYNQTPAQYARGRQPS